MSYAFTKTDRAPQPALIISRRVSRSQIAAAIGEALPRIAQFAGENGIALAGHPFCRYPEMESSPMTIEIGFPVAGPVERPADPEIKAVTLPGGPMAMTLHQGPYDQLPAAFDALDEWLKREELTPDGAPWESYINDPGALPNPQEWKTEVWRPLSS